MRRHLRIEVFLEFVTALLLLHLALLVLILSWLLTLNLWTFVLLLEFSALASCFGAPLFVIMWRRAIAGDAVLGRFFDEIILLNFENVLGNAITPLGSSKGTTCFACMISGILK